MNFFDSFDLESTIRDYEFTRLARRQIRRVVDAETFQDMDPDEIFRFLSGEIILVSFRDYLKRYLYESAGMTEPFREIDDSVWQDAIMCSFEENSAPHSFEPTTTRWTATVRSWLKSERVRRTTVFLLGFGLKMPEEDVSDFLTKVIQEDDFRMDDPEEVIFRYCFRHGLPFAKARELQRAVSSAGRKSAGSMPGGDCLKDEASLLGYLSALAGDSASGSRRQAREQAFRDLYDRSRETAAEIYSRDVTDDKGEGRTWRAEEITPADLEQILCNGIPMTESGNLTKANLSLLARHFGCFRLSRQRLDGLLRGQLSVERYDLITLSFFLYSQMDTDPQERLSRFLEETNGILSSCGMGGVYPAHPYEAFLLICTLSDCPLALCGDIWELSYSAAEE